MIARRSTDAVRRRWILAAIVVAAVVATVGLAEIGGRVVVDRAATAELQERTHAADASVDIDSSSLLLDLATGRIDEVHATVEAAEICDIAGIDVDATVRDVAIRGQRAVGRTEATVSLSEDGLSDAVNVAIAKGIGGDGSDLSSLIDATVSTDAAAGTITVGAGLGGMIEVDVAPTIEGDAVLATITGARVGGSEVPVAAVTRLLRTPEALTQSLPEFPMGLRADSLEVTDRGLTLEVSSERGVLPDGTGFVCPT